MTDTISVQVEGKTYCCGFPTGAKLSWFNPKDNSVPPQRLVHKLNRSFLNEHASTVLARWGNEDLITFNELLGFLRATEDDYRKLGLSFLVEEGSGGEVKPRSPLHVLGYRVGKSGLGISERRAILERAYREKLPNIGNAAYMAAWGLPGTTGRLKAILRQLQFNISGLGNPAGDYTEAVTAWKEDIGWLKATYAHDA